MSQQSITRTGKLAIGLAILAAVLSIAATLITYFRSGKINVMPIMSGLIVSLLVIMIVTMKKNHRL